MRTITVNGETLRVMYAGVWKYADQFKTQIYPEGKGLGQIAGILDENAGIVYDNDGKQTTFEGYSHLIQIEYAGETVLAFLAKEAE